MNARRKETMLSKKQFMTAAKAIIKQAELETNADGSVIGCLSLSRAKSGESLMENASS